MPDTARKWLIAITVAVGGGLLVSAVPAHAAEAGPPVAAHVSGVTAVPAAVGSKGRICLTSSSSYCLESNGIGHQVTITNKSSDYSVFTVVAYSGLGGLPQYQWQNASGNCLRISTAGSGETVVIKDGRCSSTDPADWWMFDLNNIQNENYLYGYMLVHGQPSNGSKVFNDINEYPGDWIRWNAPT